MFYFINNYDYLSILTVKKKQKKKFLLLEIIQDLQPILKIVLKPVSKNHR